MQIPVTHEFETAIAPWSGQSFLEDLGRHQECFAVGQAAACAFSLKDIDGVWIGAAPDVDLPEPRHAQPALWRWPSRTPLASRLANYYSRQMNYQPDQGRPPDFAPKHWDGDHIFDGYEHDGHHQDCPAVMDCLHGQSPVHFESVWFWRKARSPTI